MSLIDNVKQFLQGNRGLAGQAYRATQRADIPQLREHILRRVRQEANPQRRGDLVALLRSGNLGNVLKQGVANVRREGREGLTNIFEPLGQKIQQNISRPVDRYFEPTEQVRARDIVRELPGAVKKVGSDILRAAPRTTVALTQATTDGKKFTPSTRFEKFVLGNEPIRPTMSNEVQQYLTSKGIDPRTAGIAASGLALGGLALDASGAGKGKVAITNLAKANKADDVVRVLRGLKIVPEEKLVAQLTKETDPTKIQQILTSKVAPVRPVAKVPGGNAPKDWGSVSPTSGGTFTAWDPIRKERLYKPGKGAEVMQFKTEQEARNALAKRYLEHQSGKATPYVRGQLSAPQPKPSSLEVEKAFDDLDLAHRSGDKEAVKKTYTNLENVAKRVGGYDEATFNTIKKMLGVSSDPLEALKNEARKYKTAEEFVNAVGKQPDTVASGLMVYTKNGSDWVQNMTGARVTNTKKIKQLDTLLNKNPKPYEQVKELFDNGELWDSGNLTQSQMGILQSLRKQGAVEKIKGSPTEHMTANGVADIWKFKSQLTDIWNKAQNIKPPTSSKILKPQVRQTGSQTLKEVPQTLPESLAKTPANLAQPTPEARTTKISKPQLKQVLQPQSPRSLSSSFDASIDKSRLNIKRQNVSQAAKQELANAVEDIKPRLEQTIGKKLSHDEIRAGANDIKAELRRTLTREDTEELGSRALALRQKIAILADETTRTGRATPELLDAIETDLAFAANTARLLGQRAIDAEPVTKGLAEQYIRAVMRAGATLDNIKAAANNVDFNNPEQAALFYRQFVKPTLGEWVDVIRYNSMLSSPLTHIVNIASNLQAGPVRALTKTVTGGVDWLGSSLSKKPREQFAGEGLAYAKGYLGEVRNAWKNMVGIMKGDILPQLQDFRESNIPLAVTGRSGQAEAMLSIPMRLLEGMDQFFMALGRGGEAGALNLRRAKGGKLPSSMSGLADEIQNQAQATIFRTKLGTKGQGTMSEAIDDLALRISELRKSDNELVAGVAKFTFPFLQTPTNIFKQGLEYGPLGLINTKTAANRAEVISKAIIGSTIMSGAAAMAFSDRITFSAPTNEKERLLWKKAGKQEYSIKVGDKWVSYNKLHPAIAFPFALVAGVKEATDNKKITDSQGETILSAASKIFNFLFDQSYMKSIGTFMDLAQGGEGTWARISSNYLQQLVPGRAIGGWFARILDEYERTGTPGASFWQKQFESLMMQTPGLRGFTPARIDETGAPIRAQYPVINALSPLRLSKENKEGVEELDVYKEEQKLRRDVNALREDVRNQLKSEQMRSSTGASAAEVAPESVDKLSKFKQGELMPGVTQRGNLYAYKIDGEIKVTSDRDKANLDVAKDTFKKTDKAIQEWGELVLRKNKDGSVTSMPKSDYTYSLNTNKMQKAKLQNNFEEWSKIAVQQIDILNQQLGDPTLDDLERIEVEERADKLLADLIKYKSYGNAFKKPKSGGRKAAALKTVSPSISKAVVPKLGRISLPSIRISGGITSGRVFPGVSGSVRKQATNPRIRG